MSYEIALTTDSSSESPCVLSWETSSWMQLKAYKQGVCPRKCLVLLSQSYILAAQTSKPLLYMWDISKEQMHRKMTCPTNIQVLTASPNGAYCAAASSETIYIWQVSTGNQLCSLTRHFQPIKCLNFTDDSSYLISGADDNVVFVWPVLRLVSQSHNIQEETSYIKPKYTWSDHSLPITSIHVGRGGKYARVATSSLDHTCKLWDLSAGHLLRSFVFDVAITSVAMDAAEYRLFAGDFHGKIYTVHLFSQTFSGESLNEHTESQCFVGHSMQVTGLSLSMDGLTLLSGSNDCTARVWDVSSRQCLKVLEHKGNVENVQIHPRFQNFDIKSSKQSLPVIGTFETSVHNFATQEEQSVPVRIFNKNNSHEKQHGLLEYVLRENFENETSGGEKELSKFDIKEKLKESNELNQALYKFTVEELLSKVQEQSENS